MHLWKKIYSNFTVPIIEEISYKHMFINIQYSWIITKNQFPVWLQKSSNVRIWFGKVIVLEWEHYFFLEYFLIIILSYVFWNMLLNKIYFSIKIGLIIFQFFHQTHTHTHTHTQNVCPKSSATVKYPVKYVFFFLNVLYKS